MAKSHREICALCNEVSRVGFWVPDKIWEAAIHISHRNDVICLRCFTCLADEKGVQWDLEINFYPVSWITHKEQPGAFRLWCMDLYDRFIGWFNRSHPEDYCDLCGRSNVIWFTDNDLWNAVMEVNYYRGIIVCPICFIKEAERQGVDKVWKVITI